MKNLKFQIAIYIFLFLCLLLNSQAAANNYNLKGKKILMLIASRNFRDEELIEPYNLFKKYGASVVISSTTLNEVKGMLGTSVRPNILIGDVKIDNYDAVIFVGGSGASQYFRDQKVLSMVRDAYHKGKLIGATCIAPNILSNAGILIGKRVTGFVTIKHNLKSRGAIYTGKLVEVDKNIITARGPEAAFDFAKKIVEALNEY